MRDEASAPTPFCIPSYQAYASRRSSRASSDKLILRFSNKSEFSAKKSASQRFNIFGRLWIGFGACQSAVKLFAHVIRENQLLLGHVHNLPHLHGQIDLIFAGELPDAVEEFLLGHVSPVFTIIYNIRQIV